MIRPHLADDDFLLDVRTAPASAGCFHLWWLGQSGFLLAWDDHRVLLDPYLSDSLTRKYATSDKPHIRMTERVVDPARLEGIGIVTSSHAHTDHLDPETLGPLVAANPEIAIVAPEAIRELVAERASVPRERPRGADDGCTLHVADFTIHGIAAAHDEVETDDAGQHLFLGYVLEFGGFTIFHSGDTILHDGLLERLHGFEIDVAILPINGRAPERRVAGNLWGHEAARLAHDIGARLVVPCHYDLFSFNTATPDAFVRAAMRLGQRYRVLHAGERWSSFELAVAEG